MSKHALSLALVIAVAASTAVAASDGWAPLSYADTRHPDATEQARLTGLWRDQVGDASFVRYLFRPVTLVDGRAAFVSVAMTTDLCEAAANAETTDGNIPTCPARVSILGSDGTTQTVRGSVCATAALPEEPPEVQAAIGTDVEVDADGLRFRARSEGGACTSKIDVPKGP